METCLYKQLSVIHLVEHRIGGGMAMDAGENNT